MRTQRTHATTKKEIQREWYVIDANENILGRLAATVAPLLMGKNKANYAPYLDTGDHVIVVNAEKIKVTGNKMEDKLYYRHSGYPGGLKTETLSEKMAKGPEKVLIAAIGGMLPTTRLKKSMLKRLHVVKGKEYKIVKFEDLMAVVEE